MLHTDVIASAHERGRRLHAEAAAERLLPRARARNVLAASLRRAADRLDPSPPPAAPFPARPARQC
jgi:hypothetical protein